MLFSVLLLSLVHPAPLEGSLLGAVPEGAYALAHCRDFAGLRARAQSNDWYRLLGSPQGEPFLRDVLGEVGRGTHSDTDQLLALAQRMIDRIAEQQDRDDGDRDDQLDERKRS